MRFIDLYNKNFKTYAFKERVKQFKTFVYLAKRNPDKYLIKWNEKEGQFNYFESTIGMTEQKEWIKFENWGPKWKTMGDFK